MHSLLYVAASLVFFMQNGLNQIFLSERVIFDVGVAGPQEHAHILFAYNSESVASGIQYENMLKLIF